MNTTEQTMNTQKGNPASDDQAPRCFRIVRFYHPRLNRKPRTIKTGLTEAEAQGHCHQPATRKEGIYFDGYDYMKGTKP